MITKENIADWLNALPKTSAVPVSLSIDEEEYQAARYVQERVAPSGSRNPGPYQHEAIYVVGKLPRCYKRRSITQARRKGIQRVCFTVAGDARDWYIAAYYEGAANDMQPHGPNFILCPFEVFDGQKIDSYEKYDRRVMTVV